MEQLLAHLACFGLLNLLLVLIGYWLVRNAMIWQSWVLLALSVFITHIIFLSEEPLLRMLALVATTFTAMKVIATAQNYSGKVFCLTFWHWVSFSIGWAGMRAQPFETFGSTPLPGGWQMIRFGFKRILAGCLLIYLAHQFISQQIHFYVPHFIVTGMVVVAFSLILHFGLLSISAGMWRLSGVRTYYLFRSPAKSRSLNEFWSKRWNLAFSEMTSVALFRPLKHKVGSVAASIIAFIFSGLLHEVAISLPVNSGYGLPLFYFIIQGAMVIIEKILLNHKVKFLQTGILSRIWVFFWLVTPMPLLFHSKFIEEIVWSLAGLDFIYLSYNSDLYPN